MLTYLFVTEAMGRGECDREFEAEQHQKPKFKVLAIGIRRKKETDTHFFHFYRSSYIDEFFLVIKLLFDSFKRGGQDRRAALPTL